MSAAPLIVQGAGPQDRFHLIGVGGSGMSALAHLLLERGATVTGSDLAENESVQRLVALGLTFYRGHAAHHFSGAGVVVYSSAIPPHNPELHAAAEAGAPRLRRATLLAALMGERSPVVVAGTHGKSTTTAMLAHVLREAGRDPSYYVGGDVPGLGHPAHWGAGSLFVAEGDESDGSLAELPAALAIILNVEREHMDHYRSVEALHAVFAELAQRTTRGVVYCADDPGARAAARGVPSAVSYGLDASDAEVRAEILEATGAGSRFVVRRGGAVLGEVVVPVPGRHNVSNATAVIAAAQLAGLDPGEAIPGFATFRPVRRRFDIVFRDKEFLVVDDYAHHPTEIRATLEAARQQGCGRVVAVFQPHRFSRTQELAPEFARAFERADRVLLTDVYGAGETPIEGVDGSLIFNAVRGEGHPAASYCASMGQLIVETIQESREGDCIVTMGAGNVFKVATTMAERLRLFRSVEALVQGKARVVRNEPMRAHTTFRVGGPADVWCEPEDEEALGRVMQFAHEQGVPLTVIGRGSNLLVRDGGIRGIVVHLAGAHFARVTIEGQTVVAGAGARLKAIVTAAKRAGLAGFEFMEGIPGNLGGALRMNAGAMGSWMFEAVESVRSMTPSGAIMEHGRDDIEVRYRNVPWFERNIALSARLVGRVTTRDEIDARLKEFSKKRWDSQPAAPSAGCVFKNPTEAPAGKLLDELGLKNLAVGGARVSEVHANFIVNDGGATASDVMALIELIRERVRAVRGIELETEVVLLGEAIE